MKFLRLSKHSCISLSKIKKAANSKRADLPPRPLLPRVCPENSSLRGRWRFFSDAVWSFLPPRLCMLRKTRCLRQGMKKRLPRPRRTKDNEDEKNDPPFCISRMTMRAKKSILAAQERERGSMHRAKRRGRHEESLFISIVLCKCARTLFRALNEDKASSCLACKAGSLFASRVFRA